MTTTIKKGQKVWWDDPVQGKSGEYDVLAVDHTRNIVQIGDGEQTFELSPEHLEITCPVSEEDRQQVDKLKEHYRTLGKQGLELIRDIVSRFDEEEFSVEGYSVPVCDEDRDPCYVYGFSVKDGKLCASLDYDSGDIREVPVDSLRIGEIFDAFCELIETCKNTSCNNFEPTNMKELYIKISVSRSPGAATCAALTVCGEMPRPWIFPCGI